MEKVSANIVWDTFLARIHSRELSGVEAKYAEIEGLNEHKKIKLCEGFASFPKLLRAAEWYIVDLPHESEIINTFYYNLLQTDYSRGKTLRQLVSEYNGNKIPASELCTVNKIRQTLAINPRIIAFTKDSNAYSIYDGWHTALAFVLEDKHIPTYLGIGKKLNLSHY